MTAREMQIEFERRLTLMNPELANSEKPDSDTIFSFLYAYTLRFVLQNYLAEDANTDDTRQQKYNKDVIYPLLTKENISVSENSSDNEDNHYVGNMPNDYLTYVRSSCTATVSYRNNATVVVPCVLVAEEDLSRVLTTAWDKKILPNAYISINTAENQSDSKFTVICDSYTKPKTVTLTYYRMPKKFNVIIGTGVSNECELPESTHMAIVEGAVEMFITENKYRLSSNSKQNKE